MSYIAPNSDIYILRGIPFDETYQHTVVFNDPTIQFTYFAGKLKYRLKQQSYQRTKRGYIRVQVLADNLYDCNYVMFRNTAYGDKWFYAFILDATYINDNVSEIHYMIDAMQTWMFDYQLNPCFVEREHTVTDNIGDNLVPEGMDIGDYMIDTATGDGQLIPEGLSIVIASTSGYMSDQDHTIIDYDGGRWCAGIWTGIRYWSFSTSADANTFIDALVGAGKKDAIQFAFLAPTSFFNLSTNVEPYEHDVAFAKPYTSIDEYLPKNKKLFTYPYQMMMVDTGGSASNYSWEYFTDANGDYSSTASLKLCGSVIDTGQYLIYPLNYKGQAHNLNECIIDRCGVQCAWNADAYKAWMAQNQYTLAAQEKVITNTAVAQSRQAGWMTGTGLGSAISGLAGAVSPGTTEQIVYNTKHYSPDFGGGMISQEISQPWTMHHAGSFNAQQGASNATGGLTQAGQGFLNFLDAKTQEKNAHLMLEATKATASLKPNIVQGSTTNGIRIGTGVWRPRVYNVHIRREFARIIDGFFTRYGYACHQFKVPTIKNRPHWTYLKTVDCSIRGVDDAPGSYIVHTIPNDDASTICTIYNSGITFWRNASEVGDYTLDNSPT